MQLPNSRSNDIIESDLGKELLIYDLLIHKAYSLNETSKIIYQACDSKTSFEELKRKYQFTDDLIYLALDELKVNNLIEDYEPENHFKGLSRREVIRKVGLATMVALPVIVGVTAAHAAQAQSANICAANGCVDGNLACNPQGPGCAVLGLVCCFAFGVCSCNAAATCTGGGGQICP